MRNPSLAVLLVALGCGGTTPPPDVGGPGTEPPTGGGGISEADCGNYAQCGVDQPCESGECFAVGDCGHSICIATADACQKICGSPECAVMESYPMQIGCN